VHFPVAGITVFPLFPVLLGFLVAAVCSPCGVSGVFILVPAEMTLWDFVSPAVSPTSQLFNIVSLPGGVIRYIKDGRMNWSLWWVLIAGIVPGMAIGGLIRIRYLTNPADFKAFIGLVLLYPGLRLLNESLRIFRKRGEKAVLVAHAKAVEGDATRETAAARGDSRSQAAPVGPQTRTRETVITSRLSWCKIEFSFWDQSYSVSTALVAGAALGIGVISGIYGIGGAVFTASFLVGLLGLPVYTVAGATLASALVGSTFGVIFYAVLAMTPLGGGHHVAPDVILGLLMGVGGFAGNYVGAFLQRYLPDRLARGTMGTLVTGLALSYVGQFFLTFATPVFQTVRLMF